MRAHAAWIVIALLAATHFGCSRQQPAATQPALKAIEQRREKGPVQAAVRIDRDAATVGESVGLSVQALAEPDVEVELPALNGTLGAFDVLNVQSPPDIPEAGRRKWSRSASLRTLVAGDAEIPAITLKFHDRRKTNPDGQVIDGEIRFDPITIKITSLQPGEFDAKNMRDIKGELDIPVHDAFRTWKIIAAIAIAIALLAAIFALIRQRSLAEASPAPPPPPAHVWALQQLDLLAAERLIERGELHPFYFRLSEIVRQYIERRFAIMAAEQTTEEFLRATRGSTLLSESHRSLLGEFLGMADMVKFARFMPGKAESEQAFAAARDFIVQTAPVEAVTTQGSARQASAHAEAAA